MAQQQSITDYDELESYSTPDGDSLRLNPDADGYLIEQDASIGMLGKTQDKLIIGNGASLEVFGNNNVANPVFASMGVTVESGGNLTASGGAMHHGVNIVPFGTANNPVGHLVQDGGDITATGGSGASTYGIRVGTGDIIQSGGIMNATGGSGEGAFGIITNRDLTQTGGTITASGGSAAGARGIMLGNSLTQSDGTINATGGSGNNASNDNSADGIGIGDNLMQTGGIINATGGSGQKVSGIAVGNYATGNRSLIQSGGTINATGGDAQEARGIAIKNDLEQSGGIINATGGSAANAHGIGMDRDLTQSGGSINATGGSAANAHGIVAGNLAQNGGNITATGGSVQEAYGIGVSALTQNDGAINATGGSAQDAHGIGVDGSLIQSGGNITAMGGSAQEARGIAIKDGLTQSSGIINATGGSMQDAHGIGMDNDLTQSGGSINATGGSVANAHGIVAGNLAQNGGNITATGGSVQGAYGIDAGNLTQSGGTINAIGGSAADAIGLQVTGAATIGSTLNASSQGAVSMAVSGNITFQGTSTYSPEINLVTGHDGLVTAGGTITIVSGATLQPKVTGATGLASGTSITRTILESGSNISSDFNLVNTASLTMNYANNDKKGELTMSYTAPVDNIGSSVGPNTRALLGMMAGTSLTGGTQYDAIDAIYSHIASAATDAGQRALARDAQLHLTPHGTTRMAHFSIDQQDAVQKVFTDNIGALALGQAGVNGMKTASLAAKTRTDAGIAARPDSIAWAAPVYETGTRHARNGEFRKADQDFGGIAIGVAHNTGDATFGIQGHYLYGKLRSSGDPYYKAQTDTFGITAGGRIDRLLPTCDTGRNSTWVQAVAGYSRESLDQTRGSYGAHHDSSPDADIWRLGVSVGRDIAAGAARISPEFGLDYTHVKMDSYTENNNANMLALHVNPDGFDSFRLKLGASGEFPVYGNLNVRGSAFYRYELGDRNMRLESAFAGAPSVTGFTTAGERIERSSGEMSIGLRYHAANDMAWGADYSIRLEDGYTGHQFGLNFAMRF